MQKFASGRRSIPLLANSSFSVLGLLLATALSGVANAQSASLTLPAEAEAEAEADSSDIIVTGTRVIRDGYEAPTPLTVLGSEELKRSALVNIAEQVTRLPALAGSANGRNNQGSVSAGNAGLSALNLRGLGQLRTLVMLDGQRLPAATISGVVDINTIPNALIKRVDIVTGGASAAYGSDAVAGVVNFILDKEFTGLKGDIQGGVTDYGDNKSYRLSLSAGTAFAEGRGHITLSGEHAYEGGIVGVPRPWYQARKTFANPGYTATNGQPQYLVANGVGYSTQAPGGIIVDTALRGTYFGPGGQTAQLNYGSLVSDPYMLGGDYQFTDWSAKDQSLAPKMSRQNIFGRISYDVTDNINVYAQSSYSRAKVKTLTSYMFFFGSENGTAGNRGMRIQRDNAFLPASVAARMDELGIREFRLGTSNDYLGAGPFSTTKDLFRIATGAEGNFDALGSNWQWDVGFYRNTSKIFNDLVNPLFSEYYNSIDAVRNPATGAIVCRVTLTNPNSGCVPYNVMGTGVNTEAPYNYLMKHLTIRQRYSQTVFNGSMSGTPFSTWAGPVSLAFGAEHRKEHGYGGVPDPVALAGGQFQGNYKPVNGDYTVKEAFFETVIPLIHDAPFTEALDFNGAVRGTRYSTSGTTWTWKAGLSWTPIEDIRVRVTRSRDIRAGNLNDLFSLGVAGTASVTDPFRNNANVSVVGNATGNPNLRPEKADTMNIGVVLKPRFLPGLQASVDYFDIKVKDAISTLTNQQQIDQCFTGNTQACAGLIRNDAGTLTQVIRIPVNIAAQVARGIDFEVSYSLPLDSIVSSWDGSLSWRALATRYLDAYTDNTITIIDPSLGENINGVPKFRYTVDLTYSTEKFSTTFTARGVSSGVLDANYIQCTSGCPTSTASNRTINNNYIHGAVYFDANAQYKVTPEIEAFVAIDNIINRDPAPASNPTLGIGSAQIGVSSLYYDVLGRSYRAGVRFKY
ncbi:TonB-dependent receptor plug domain-containing protein [Rhizorhabdus sp. FW153]|uniref:TonB-dependent receptor plug domain-containing protein n=1 Tax=Rhizorhabdus sp. FW153 TaxID=3400216 RepID=UPI003CF20CA5